MSKQLDRRLVNSGTKFLIYPQPRWYPSFATPETVWINHPPGSIAAGPADDRMYVVDALGKRPYQFDGPPYRGPRNVPVPPGPSGHFDHLQAGSREFNCATMYATVRRVMDVWEDYFGRRVEWHFRANFARLEMIPQIDWDNAQSGYGFLEFGFGRQASGAIDYANPYCQNFDVLAHELGHSIIFAEVGVPDSDDANTADYGGMHESSGDLVAIVATLHFDSVVKHLLDSTCGNLFTSNELSRTGELSESREIRVAFNDLRMSDVGDEPHDRSQPLTGGIFDILVEVFQKNLVRRNLISQALADMANNGPGAGHDVAKIQDAFAAAYKGKAAEFHDALLEARDYVGTLLARTWDGMSANHLTYVRILERLMDADRALTGGANEQTIRDCFGWREIAPAAGSMLLTPHRLDDCMLRQPTRQAAPATPKPYAARTGTHG